MIRNNSFFGKVDPQWVAKTILRELCINTNEPTDLYAIAAALNIVVRKQAITTGVLGACKAVGLKRLIILDPNIGSEGRERFTFAHEIGHIVLRHGTHCCREEDFVWKARKPSIEQDANIFASELLMPTVTFSDIARKSEITFDLSLRLATKFKVSMMAMAIRLVELSPDPTVLLYIEKEKVVWSTFAKDMPFLEPIRTIENDIIKRISPSTKIESSIFFNNVSDNAKCFAEVKQYSNFGVTMCLLKLIDEDDDYEDN